MGDRRNHQSGKNRSTEYANLTLTTCNNTTKREDERNCNKNCKEMNKCYEKNACEETWIDDERGMFLCAFSGISATARMWCPSKARYRKLAHDASKSRWHCF